MNIHLTSLYPVSEEKIGLPNHDSGFVFVQPRVLVDPFPLELSMSRGRETIKEFGMLVTRHEGGFGCVSQVPFAWD